MRQLATILITIVTLAVGLSISLVVFAMLAVVGGVADLYFWWKTRALRRHLKEHIAMRTSAGQTADGMRHNGAIIDGEWRNETPQGPVPMPLLHSIDIVPPLSDPLTEGHDKAKN